jgi:hypothetical protein
MLWNWEGICVENRDYEPFIYVILGYLYSLNPIKNISLKGLGCSFILIALIRDKYP